MGRHRRQRGERDIRTRRNGRNHGVGRRGGGAVLEFAFGRLVRLALGGVPVALYPAVLTFELTFAALARVALRGGLGVKAGAAGR